MHIGKESKHSFPRDLVLHSLGYRRLRYVDGDGDEGKVQLINPSVAETIRPAKGPLRLLSIIRFLVSLAPDGTV